MYVEKRPRTERSENTCSLVFLWFFAAGTSGSKTENNKSFRGFVVFPVTPLSERIFFWKKVKKKKRKGVSQYLFFNCRLNRGRRNFRTHRVLCLPLFPRLFKIFVEFLFALALEIFLSSESNYLSDTVHFERREELINISQWRSSEFEISFLVNEMPEFIKIPFLLNVKLRVHSERLKIPSVLLQL